METSIAKFNGVEIRIGEEMCLTDMWKAAGENENQKPRFWLSQEEARGLMQGMKEKGISNTLFRAERGRHGGTWAHWQLGLAYAKYLNPKFHLWANEIVKRFVNADATIAESVIDRIDDPAELARIELRAKGRRATKALCWDIRERGGSRWTYPYVLAGNTHQVTGKLPCEIKEEAGVPNTRSSRDFMDVVQLDVLASLEHLQSAVVQKTNIHGHNQICDLCSDVRHEFGKVVERYIN